jgi:hypothetical protein
MLEVRHPRTRDDVAGHPPAAVSVRGSTYAVDRDDTATVALPDEGHVEALAAAYDLAPEALRGDGAETCQVEKSDGEICGRDLPCPYHSEGDD